MSSAPDGGTAITATSDISRTFMRGRFLTMSSISAGTGQALLDGHLHIKQHGVEGAGGAIAVQGPLLGTLKVRGLARGVFTGSGPWR